MRHGLTAEAVPFVWSLSSACKGCTSRPCGTIAICVSPPRTTSWAKLNRPCGTACKFAVLTQTLKPSSVQPLCGTAEAVLFVQSLSSPVSALR